MKVYDDNDHNSDIGNNNANDYDVVDDNIIE